VAGPTLELMAQEHPRLPATFYHLFTGALNRWVRTRTVRSLNFYFAVTYSHLWTCR
jgi:hypothetical protein